DVDERQRDRMRERDERARLLGGTDTRDASGAEDVALRPVAGLDGSRGRRVHPDARRRHRAALALGLAADVDHPGGAVGADVCQAGGAGLLPSTHRDSPPSFSRFQIGASALIRSIASRAPANASPRWAAAAATITL